MIKAKVSIVAAISKKNAALGRGGKLLFHISDDLKRFKEITLGHPIIMGRKTFESILDVLDKPLPGRKNIVITRQKDYVSKGVNIADSLEKALALAEETGSKEIFIGGGGEIYKQALPFTDNLYLTLVESDAEGDVFFPDWRKYFTKETFREERFDQKTGLKYTWINLERKS